MRRTEAKAAVENTKADDLFTDGLDGPSMGPQYDRIVERIFSLNPMDEFDTLKHNLTLGKKGHELTFHEILDALELAEDNARRAHALFCHAKLELEKFEIDAAVTEGAMRKTAQQALFAMKEAGEFKKTIAIADVDAYMASHFIDEYRSLKVRREKNKLMVEHIETLAGIWRDRRRTLEALSNRVRG